MRLLKPWQMTAVFFLGVFCGQFLYPNLCHPIPRRDRRSDQKDEDQLQPHPPHSKTPE